MMYCLEDERYLDTVVEQLECDNNHRERTLHSVGFHLINWLDAREVFYGLPEQGVKAIVAVNHLTRQIELEGCAGTVRVSKDSLLWIHLPTRKPCLWETGKCGWIKRMDAKERSDGVLVITEAA
uniref:Uncharacterized protein n=1 Tax=viral metagenome TaxID=1070528 RepID=A0A6M3IE69_9ZZZZ